MTDSKSRKPKDAATHIGNHKLDPSTLMMGYGFDAALTLAYDKHAPHFLAEHAFTLAQAFSGFYQNCPIMPEHGEVRASRLALASAALKQLTLTLELLGIEVPERM